LPELPEVETVRTGLEAAVKGALIQRVQLRRANLRVPFTEGFAAAVAGQRIVSIVRRAKYLLFHLDGGGVIISHLGMSGRFLTHAKPPRSYEKHDHVVMYLADGRVLVYNDARRFGIMVLARREELNTHPLLAVLGPEPLEASFTPAYLKRVLSGRHVPIKPVLMEQSVVVGVGNIYASEALFLAGIDPRKPASELAGKATRIIECIRKVLADAIASGGSSLRDFVQVSGDSGYFQHHFNVYDREGEPCFTCATPIICVRQSGRSTYFCPTCQH
jgi:formamidopyrimidine-DNA glycosylase